MKPGQLGSKKIEKVQIEKNKTGVKERANFDWEAEPYIFY